jgi:hypothetical protein
VGIWQQPRQGEAIFVPQAGVRLRTPDPPLHSGMPDRQEKPIPQRGLQASAQIEQALAGCTCREQCTRGRQHTVARDPKEPRIPRSMAARLAKVALARVLALTLQKKEPPDLVARAARLARFRQTVQHRAVRESVAEEFHPLMGGTLLLDHFPAE